MIITPMSACISRVKKDKNGVGMSSRVTYALIPFAAMTHATFSLNKSEWIRLSHDIATAFCPQAAMRSAIPCVTLAMVSTFRQLVPAPNSPRTPAVPNSNSL